MTDITDLPSAPHHSCFLCQNVPHMHRYQLFYSLSSGWRLCLCSNTHTRKHFSLSFIHFDYETALLVRLPLLATRWRCFFADSKHKSHQFCLSVFVVCCCLLLGFSCRKTQKRFVSVFWYLRLLPYLNHGMGYSQNPPPVSVGLFLKSRLSYVWRKMAHLPLLSERKHFE